MKAAEFAVFGKNVVVVLVRWRMSDTFEDQGHLKCLVAANR